MSLLINETWEGFVSLMRERQEGIILFGGSSCADIFLNKLSEKFNVKYIIDNDKNKQNKIIFDKYMVYSIDKLKDVTEDDLILITSTYYSEILQQLKQVGFSGKVYSFLHLRNKIDKNLEVMKSKLPLLKELCCDEKSKHIIEKISEKRIIGEKNYSDIYEPNQYFVEGIMHPCEEEVFVDGGAYDGQTVREVIKFEQNKFKKIYSFEMDKKNYELIPKGEFDYRVEFYNYGLWDEATKVSFIENKNGSEIASDGNASAECIALDEFINDKVTFIKMDIEGAEMKALKGAKGIISRDKPKLAICLYHKPKDLWEIPFYIHELVPEYKIYIRHHSRKDEETVMYAHI